MPFIFARMMLACVALAMAGYSPSDDVSLGLRWRNHSITVHADGSGEARFEGLAPGDYVLTVPGRSLIAARDRSAPRGGRRPAGLTIAIGDGAPTFHPFDFSGNWNVSERIPIPFNVPRRAGVRDARPVDVRVTISDQASAGNLSSY